MDLLAGAAFSWCVVYVLLAVFFAILASRRPDGGSEYATFATACVLVGGYAFCNAQQCHLLDPVEAARWGSRGQLFAGPAVALIVHVSVMYAELEQRMRVRVLVAAYAGMVVIVLATALGLTHLTTVSAQSMTAFGVAFKHHRFDPGPARIVVDLLFLLGIGGTLALLVRAYLRGKREALLACLGGIILLATAINDVLVVESLHRSIYLSEHGFSAFAFGLSYTLLARHERVSDELTKKGAELRRRAKQLRRAYEELRAAQEELVRKEQLALVGELAAVISHEVRNPLAIISNAVAGLRREGLSADDRHTLLSILQEETDRLNRLVGDLLRYARPLQVERQLLELDALLDRALELARVRPNIRLDTEVALESESSVFGDANMLRQVFDNLVQNACQAMSNGGTLTVRANASSEDGVPGVTVDIGDTGEGMDTQVRSRAGTPFFTTRPEGTGLGLAICDRIVTAHGGFLAIKSRSGEGTVVSVFLPANVQNDSMPLLADRPGRSSHPPSEKGASEKRASTLPPSTRPGTAEPTREVRERQERR